MLMGRRKHGIVGRLQQSYDRGVQNQIMALVAQAMQREDVSSTFTLQNYPSPPQ